jgi:hypothetical protein
VGPSPNSHNDRDILATTPPQVVHLAERFRVEHGLITEIEAIFSVNTIQTSGF